MSFTRRQEIIFEGICLVDTFDLAEDRQLPLFALDNTRRVEAQKETDVCRYWQSALQRWSGQRE